MAYLDHAATTPMLPEAVDALTSQLRELGNSSSLHAAGRRARRVVEESRETVAAAFDARPSDVIFTGSGTEADNLAVKGIYWARVAESPERRRILCSAIEHHAVLDAVEWLGGSGGAVVEWLTVDPYGRLDVDALRDAVERDPQSVALITVMWANNEVGTVQPIAEVVAIAALHGIPVHSDAVQAIGQLDVSFAASGLAAMSTSGHKFGGPLGVGALLLSRGLDIVALIHGGGQERDVRSGTHDTPHIAAFATAAQLAVDQREVRVKRVIDLRDDLVAGIRLAVPDAVLNGPELDSDVGSADGRLPGNAHFSFPGCEGDALLMLLDAQDVECSTGSACSAGVAQPSHVLTAIGASPELALASLRFSLGHTSTGDDVAAAVAAIGPAVERARGATLAVRPDVS